MGNGSNGSSLATALHQGQRNSRGGRRAEPPIAKGLKTVRRTLAEYAQMFERVDGLSSADLESTRRMIDDTRRVLEGLSSSLREREAGEHDD
jgi:hypothetical protein